MVVKMMEGFVRHQLVDWFKSEKKKKKLRSKRDILAMLKSESYLAPQVLDVLHNQPLYVYPEQSELESYAKAFFDKYIKKRGPVPASPDAALHLLKNEKVRRIVEILIMAGMPAEEIMQVLKREELGFDGLTESVIDSFLELFWNYRSLNHIEKKLFFNAALKAGYFKYHRCLFSKTHTPEAIFPLIGIHGNASDPVVGIKGCILALVENQLPDAILRNDIKNVRSITSAIKALTDSYNNLGGEGYEAVKKLSDYVRVTYSDCKPELTPEDIERHNAEIDRENALKVKREE